MRKSVPWPVAIFCIIAVIGGISFVYYTFMHQKVKYKETLDPMIAGSIAKQKGKTPPLDSEASSSKSFTP